MKEIADDLARFGKPIDTDETRREFIKKEAQRYGSESVNWIQGTEWRRYVDVAKIINRALEDLAASSTESNGFE